jgi:hypothetical protein
MKKLITKKDLPMYPAGTLVEVLESDAIFSH